MKKYQKLKRYEAKFLTNDGMYAWENFEASTKQEAESIADDILNDNNYKRLIYVAEKMTTIQNSKQSSSVYTDNKVASMIDQITDFLALPYPDFVRRSDDAYVIRYNNEPMVETYGYGAVNDMCDDIEENFNIHCGISGITGDMLLYI